MTWAVLDADGELLERFAYESEAREATYTGEYPEDAEVAFLNEECGTCNADPCRCDDIYEAWKDRRFE